MGTLPAYFRARRFLLRGFSLAFCLYSLVGYAEEGRPILKSFGQSETGTGDIFWATAQDERGVLYFGSGVLLRFDGEHWEQHRVPGSHAIRALAKGENGRLWVAAINEIGYFDRNATGSLTEYTSLVPKLPAGTAELGDVWHVFTRGESTVFVTSDSILIWNGRSFRIIHLPGGRRLVGMQVGERIFIGQVASGLWSLDGEKLNLFISAVALENAGVMWMAESGNGWLLVTNHGLARYENGRVTWFGAEAADFIKRNILATVCRLRDGRLCVGTINGGLGIISPSGALSRVLTPREGLQATSVSSIFEDRDGGVWVTSSLGVTRIVLNGGASLFDRRQGLRGRPCKGIAESGSRLYVSTDDGVFNLPMGSDAIVNVQPVAGLHERFSDLAGDHGDLYAAGSRGLDRLRDNQVSRIYSTTKGDILLFKPSTAQPGSYFLVENFELLRVVATASGEMKATELAHLPDDATTIAEDTTGLIWVGTDSRGIFRVRNAPNSPAEPFHALNRPARSVRGFVARAGRSVLVGADSGLELFSGESQESAVPNSPHTQALAISNQDAEGRVWVAFEGPFSNGAKVPVLGRFSTGKNGDGVWEPFAVEGLTQIGGVTRLFVDSRGILWVGGQDGLLRFEPGQLKRTGEPNAPLISASIKVGAKIEADQNSISFDFSAVEFGRREALRFQTKLSGGGDWSAPSDSSHLSLAGLRDGNYELAVRVINDAGMTSAPATWRFTVLPPWYKTKAAFAGWILLGMAGFFGIVQWRSAYLRRQNIRLEALVQKKTEQLEKANAAKSEFLANMSHEIRNPISGIVGLSLAMEETTLDERQRQLTNSIRSCATLLATLVDDVLDFSKIEAGKIELRPAPFDLRASLEQCAMMVAEETRTSGVKITISVDREVPDVLVGDSARVQQIVLNYLTNALKFGIGKPITIGARPGAAGRIWIYVRDLGPGLTVAETGTLFAKFSRLEQPRALNIRGTGLGLAVCRLLAAKMGGSVGVDSSPGEGSCFWAELPLSPGGPLAKSNAGERASAVSLSALIVEDIDYNAVAMQAVLRKLGVKSEVATDGPAALRQLQAKFYDLAFMDWNLPGMIGTEVVSRFRAIEPPGRHTIIIATTAYSADFNREACFQAGMDAFIAKPLTPEKIASALQDLRGSLRAASSVEVHRSIAQEQSPKLEGLDLQLLHFLAGEIPGGIGGQIDRYLASFDSDRRIAREIVATGDATEIHRIAHRLISHSSMVKYEPLTRLAFELQANAGSHRPELLARLFNEFEGEFANLRSKLESIRISTAPA